MAQTLVKANVGCDALLFLASPKALDSDECRRQVRRAEDDRKDVIVAILGDVRLGDPRQTPWMDRQIVDLSSDPRDERVSIWSPSWCRLADGGANCFAAPDFAIR